MNKLIEKIEQRSITDRIIEKSVELYDFTPEERSDANVNWMVEKDI